MTYKLAYLYAVLKSPRKNLLAENICPFEGPIKNRIETYLKAHYAKKYLQPYLIDDVINIVTDDYLHNKFVY